MQKARRPSVYYDDCRIMTIDGRFRLLAPNRIACHIKRLLLRLLKHNPRYLAHLLADFSRSVPTIGSAEAHFPKLCRW
ncbi:hypothetical protein D3C85_1816250 [compost metagenome]